MLKLKILIGLLTATLASHEFNSERHFMCQLCEKMVELKEQNDQIGIDAVYENFPALNRFIPKESLNVNKNTCHQSQLCQIVLEDDKVPDFTSIVEEVNRSQTTWQATIQPKFQDMTKSQIKHMMGTIVDPDWTVKSEPKQELTQFLLELPTTFDAREQWSQCASVIGHVRDQANCGSCWAHGTTEAFNDRLCIKSNGQFTTLLSTADTTGCCGFLSCFSQGCNGGQIGTPWTWFKNTGVVSGGDFGDKQTCYPYTMPFCAHHVDGTSYPSCSEIKEVDPTCSKKCDNGASYSSDKHKALSSYGLSNVNAIKNDLYQYGSVTAAFTVYEDFVNYKSGVYRHVSGSALGGHAVKIIGWGEDHWIVVNSWNETWGDGGLFKIAFGECGIDSQCHAGLV